MQLYFVAQAQAHKAHAGSAGNEREEAMAVGGGFLQVARDQVLILADSAERADEVDEARAEEARRRARETLANAVNSGQHLQAEAARTALHRADARIQVARRHRRAPSADSFGR